MSGRLKSPPIQMGFELYFLQMLLMFLMRLSFIADVLPGGL